MTTIPLGLRRAAVLIAGPLVAAILASTMPTAHAADAKGSYAIRGAGSVTCSTYVNASPQQKTYAQTWWAGYLTAMNRVTPNTYHLLGTVSVETADAWLVKYCQANPDTLFETAVNQMLKTAYPNRTQAGE